MSDGQLMVNVELLRSNPAMVKQLYERMGVVEHPILKLPTAEQLGALLKLPNGPQALLDMLTKRQKRIKDSLMDPLRYGFKLKSWEDADALLQGRKDICVLGGNRSSKSEWAAFTCVQKLKQPGKIVWCLSTTAKTSQRDQQKLIWKYLPPEWKNLKKTLTTRITYNAKDGFADNAFVLPNGSECQFMNYKQDRDVIEGGQVDLWWGDEMIPVDWVVTLRGRTVDRHGQGIVTFTPVRGASATVAEYITGAKVTATETCELLPDQQCWPGLPHGKVPYILQCLNPEHAVIFFQSKYNVFIDYNELKKLWAARSRSDILIRLHGVTDKRSGNIFPRFGVHNIIPHGKIPAEGTNWHFMDFAWNRKWFMIWLRVWEINGKKRIYLYREWPDFETYGEWAVPSEKPDGERGPAQETLGYSINDYKRLMWQLEGNELKREEAERSAPPLPGPLPHSANGGEGAGARPSGGQDKDGSWGHSPHRGTGEVIFKRLGDPRSGAVQSVQTDEVTTILDMLNEPGEDGLDIEVHPVQADGTRSKIVEGVNLVNQWLEYDDEQPIGLENEPILYISDRCRNVIECMKLWTGQGGEKGASKDPIDLLRYAAVTDIEYFPEGSLEVWGGVG